MGEEIRYARLHRWVVLLAQGWRLNLGWGGLVVEPMLAHHGDYAVLMWRPVAGEAPA